MQTLTSVMVPGSLKHDLIHHFHRLTEQPNIPFLNSIVSHITTFISGLSVAGILASYAVGRAPLQPLESLSNKLAEVITFHGANFYKGARFYFQNNTWHTLTIQTYTEQQHLLLHNHSNQNDLKKLVAPHFSTFNIQTSDELNSIFSTMLTPTNTELFAFILSVFNDAVRSDGLTRSTLNQLLGYIIENRFGTNPRLDILNYLQLNFSANFNLGYFEERKRLLGEVNSGLTATQKHKIQRCRFLPEQEKAIIEIESTLVRKNPDMAHAELDILNDHFINLKNITIPEDFTLLVERLASMREQFSATCGPLSQLIALLIRKRTMEEFNQLFYRNKIEKCTDEHLITKFVIYIEQLKPLTHQDLALDKIVIQEILGSIVLNTHPSRLNDTYARDIEALIAQLNTVAKAHPHIQHYLLDAFNHIADKNTGRYFEHVLNYGRTIQALKEILASGTDEAAKENMFTIYSLLANFHKKPAGLIALFDQINRLTDVNQKRFMLIFVSRLLDNNKSIDGLDRLISQIMEAPAKFELFKKACTTPPYAKIATLVTWLESPDFSAQHEEFTLSPYGERRIDFAFNRANYSFQAHKFEGLTTPGLFNGALGDEIERLLNSYRLLSFAKLKDEFNALKTSATPLDNNAKLKLLCLGIEILARTSAQYDHGIPPRIISQELNTTQVMALYAMLVNEGNKLISEIDTGEGKSRIMMVLAACQAAQGKTVDFITSDMQLAERDYLTYNQFFIALGLRTSLISLTTPAQLYQKGGVNFSDNAQLLLLRNKSDITGEPFAYLDEEESRRCLLVDEVDKFKHDKSRDAYNYAATSKKLTGFVWIYPLLMRFMQEKMIGHSIQTDALVDDFLTYVQSNDTHLQHQASIADLKIKNPNQIKTWLRSAYIAWQMESDRHYKVTSADEDKLYPVRDAEHHTRYSRKVLVLDNGRIVEGSSFSDGVHQCLCAKENFKAGREEFVILPENETQRASYPVTFIGKYDHGHIYGVSGTTRSAAPRARKEINYEGYSYIRVPREKRLIRDDKNTLLAKDKEQQLAFMKDLIIEKLRKQQPILLICKDDNQSHEFAQALSADSKFMNLVKKLQHVHGLTPSQEEKEAIKNAGEPGYLTISTAGMFGRGVDIHASNLFVLAAYVPTLEDDKQIRGRTARAGKRGEFRMVVNMHEPHSALNGKTYNIDNEIIRLQKAKALTAVFREEVSKLYALFLEEVTQKFLQGYHAAPADKRPAFLAEWQVFLGNLQKEWRKQADELITYVETENKTEFTHAFNAFTTRWTAALPGCASTRAFGISTPDKTTQIYQGLLSQKSFFVPKREAIKIQARYDIADDGQARIYSSLFAQTAAMLRGERRLFANFHAWREGRGVLFADLMAVLKGERALFANLIATIQQLKAAPPLDNDESPIVDM